MEAAEREAGVVIPGYTHLQRAQPVLAAHYFLAYVEKLQRDRERLADCRKRVNVLPLGPRRWPAPRCRSTANRCGQQLGFADVAAQQPRCLQRSRFRPRVRVLPVDDRDAPGRVGGRMGAVVDD